MTNKKKYVIIIFRRQMKGAGSGNMKICKSCGKEYKTPSFLAEISVPLVVLLMVALIIIGDSILLSYLCRY